MNGEVCPCAVCEERFIGCHAECDVYKAWKEDQAKIKQARKDYYDPLFSDMTSRRINRMAKFKRRHKK